MRVEPAEPAEDAGEATRSDAPPDLDVFVSYSRRDVAFALDLHAFLTERGKDVWIDSEDIPASAPWRADIEAGIDGADNVVFVVSPDSLASENCARELEHAQLRGKRIVPVVCREADPALAPPVVAELNWIFAREGDDRDAALETVVRAIETDLDWVRAHTRLLVRAVEWDAQGRDGSFVLRGSDLRTAEELLDDHADADPAPTPLQTEYVLASRRASARRQRVTLAAVAVALAVSVCLGVLFLVQRNAANERAAVATSRELAAGAVGQLASDPELALILAAAAVDTKDTNEAVSALRRTLVASRVRGTLQAPRALSGGALSADGRAFVAADDRGGAHVWDVGGTETRPRWSGKLAAVPGGPNWLDPYGRKMVAARAVRRRPTVDANASIVSEDWGTADSADLAASPSGAHGVEIYCLEAYLVDARRMRTADLRGVAGAGGDCPPYQPPLVRFSPDERLVVVAAQAFAGGTGPEGGDTSVRVFRTDSGAQKAQLIGHTGHVGAVAFSPDGTLVATGGDDGTARIWDAATGRQLAVLSGHRGAVTGVAFTSDGARVATTSEDRTVRFWSAAPNGSLVLDGDLSAISVDGAYAATARTSGELRVRRSDGALIMRVRGPRGEHSSLGVADDGSIVVVDGNAFATRTGKRLSRFDPGLTLSLSADARWALATMTQLWAVRADRRVQWLGADRLDEVGFFSSDDTLLAVIGGGDFEGGSAGNEVRLWRIPAGTLAHRFYTRDPWVRVATISPDDRLVAAGGVEGEVDVWDTESYELLSRTGAHRATLTALAFAPGSDLLATAADDGTVRLLEPRTGNRVAALTGHSQGVSSVAFSPDGKLVVTGSLDRTVRVWNAATGESLLVLPAAASVNRAAFAGNGRLVVAALENGSVVRYACDVCGPADQLLARAKERMTRPLTPDERRRYLHRS